MYRVPPPLAAVATSTLQPGETRIKSSPVHEPTLIHWFGLLEDHSLPQ